MYYHRIFNYRRIKHSASTLFRFWIFPTLCVSALSIDAAELEPGIYRDFFISMEGNDWRVTDPQAPHPGAQAFLPNPVLTIEDIDLKGATHAVLAMHHWIGHGGTEGQEIVINGTHRIRIPLNENLQAPNPASYLNNRNLALPLPLEWIHKGANTLEGAIAEEFQGHHWWGQWGWYWVAIRVFYDESVVHAPDGQIRLGSDHRNLTEDLVKVRLETSDPDAIQSVTLFAKYYGFDEDGDYRFHDWHGFENEHGIIEGAADTCNEAPFELEWDLSWIPDQRPETVGLIAKILGKDGFVRITQPILGLSIERDYSVKMYHADNWPTQLVRNQTAAAATIEIPSHVPLRENASAQFLIRTWNGMNNEFGHTPVILNQNRLENELVVGNSHHYGFDQSEIPLKTLSNGRNHITFFSETHHHGCEVLVPGPAILIKWPDQKIGDW